MKSLRYTLLSDGSSDQALIPILTWLLRELGVRSAIQPAWADLRRLPKPPNRLDERIRTSLALFPCELLFVHRDAEQEPLETRTEEIRNAFSQATAGMDGEPPAVCVVPVRMTEAWLLSSEAAIRAAAGNPLGKDEVHLPEPSQVESLPEPKDLLYETLRSASGLTGRRKQRLRVGALTHRVAELTGDFAALRQLRAFVALESELGAAIRQNGWAES